MDKQKLSERLKSYTAIDTQSDYESPSCPSTEKQKNLAKALVAECKSMGFDSVELSEDGYVYCFLKGNNPEAKQSVGFIAHMDTSPDCSGANVQAQIFENYDGADLALGGGRVIRTEMFPEMKAYKGMDIMTAGGDTLLGADDKAGIAEIMTAMEAVMASGMSRPDVYVSFSPDEEIGRGMDRFDLNKFKADLAYTVDGGAIGELEYESFNAARAFVTIEGESVHPGSAKGVMKNALLMAAEFIESLPKKEVPAETEGYEGFFHACDLTANVEKAKVTVMIRDFDKDSFEERKKRLTGFVDAMNRIHGNRFSIEIKDEYFNMGDVISKKMAVVDIAKQAYEQAGVPVKIKPVRGGTDGSKLSFMGIPCPNLFTGGHNYHGPYEFIPLQSMEKAVAVIVNIIKIFSNLR